MENRITKFTDNMNIYAIIDELYKKFTRNNISKRYNKDKTKLSYSEIITISICKELMIINS